MKKTLSLMTLAAMTACSGMTFWGEGHADMPTGYESRQDKAAPAPQGSPNGYESPQEDMPAPAGMQAQGEGAKAGEGAAYVPPAAPEDLYKCDPAVFTLTKRGAGLLLEGGLEVPTPGYTYALRGTGESRVLELTAPPGMVMQVISELAVSVPVNEAEVTSLVVDIEKPFDWGVNRIRCNIVG